MGRISSVVPFSSKTFTGKPTSTLKETPIGQSHSFGTMTRGRMRPPAYWNDPPVYEPKRR